MVSIQDFLTYLPEATLLIATFVVFLLDVAGVKKRAVLGGVSTAFILLVLLEILGDLRAWPFSALATISQSSVGTVNGPIIFTSFGFIFQAVFASVALLVSFASLSDPDEEGSPTFYALLLLAVLGMLIVAVSADLILLLLAVEVTGISTYVLVGYTQKDRRALEAAMKFYIIGALSTTISFFGASLLFGAYGTTSLAAFAPPNSPSDPALALVGFAMVAAGLGFKATLVPFHMWAVDVYDGAPSTVSAFLSAGSKKMGLFAIFAIFVGAVRVFGVAGEGYSLYFALGALAVITMTIGNVLALEQQTMKRMLAYSSIAQAGYMLLGIAVDTPPALAGATLQIIANVLMKGGAFIVVAIAVSVGIGPLITDYKGLGHTRPGLAACFAVMLLSLAGMPLTLGFVGKFYLFFAAIEAGGWFTTLAVAGLLNSAISVFYYARVLKYMYMPDEGVKTAVVAPPRALAHSKAAVGRAPGAEIGFKVSGGASMSLWQEIKSSGMARWMAVFICAFLILLFGIYPTPMLNMINTAAQQFWTLGI
jgi:NADH-quinone oxidoreductase subunit N